MSAESGTPLIFSLWTRCLSLGGLSNYDATVTFFFQWVGLTIKKGAS